MSKYFSERELECPCCSINGTAASFAAKLDSLRETLGVPLIVSSGYRCPEWNRRCGGAAQSAHVLGRGVDILCSGELALNIVELARTHGFTGVGVKQHGDHETRFVHLDDLISEPGQPRPWVWSY